MIRVFLWLLAFALPARAEIARVISGEHADFTRLVVKLPDAEGWSLGRTPDGYAFTVGSEVPPEFDIDSVWQRISRSRLTALEVDSASGVLSLSLGCSCHIFPFEYGTGIVVLDIKDGPAPAGSAFEADFQLPDARPAPATADAAPAYDWISSAKEDTRRPSTEPSLPLATGSVSLEPLRDELLEQIAKGAVDGLVDIEMPVARRSGPESPDVPLADLPWSHIRIGEEPGVVVTRPGALIAEASPDAACPPVEMLDVAAWGAGRLPSEILTDARSSLFGEFDVPDREAVLRSVKDLLYLGFGAEARQHADFLGSEAWDEAAGLYRSMAWLVDGDRDPQSPFAKMLACDGPAALWAALALDRLPPGPETNRDAILQAYQALPPHLRRHLGPALAERFLAHIDSEAARIIRDAVERSAEADPAAIALLDAKAELHAGNADRAQVLAEAAVEMDGDRAESLIALVEAHFQKLQPIDRGLPEALIALRGETDPAALGPALDRAIVLSLALSDQTEAAFLEKAAEGDLKDDLWRVVQSRAVDDEFLRFAVLSSDAARPKVSIEVARAVADRLLALGFPDAALVWLGPVTAVDAPEVRLRAAKASFESGDAREAVELLDGLSGPDVEALRAEALLQLGDLGAAADAWVAAGNAEAAARLELWAGDWRSLDPGLDEPWLQAADYARSVPPAEATGLLGRGSKSVEDSLASRAAVEALLNAVPTPAENGSQ